MMQAAAREPTVWMVAALTFLMATASGDARAEPAPELQDACPAGDAERLAFLEGRLEDGAGYARKWWYAWNSVYVLGMGVESTRAALADDRGDRADRIASAIKSSIGLTRNLWAPTHAKNGIDELTALPADDPAGCTARLEKAEDLMRRNARQSRRERKSWQSHAFNVGINLGTGILVAELYDHDQAYVSAALGIVVGEIRNWSFPWHAEGDWKAYQEEFAQRPEVSWTLVPWGQGLMIVVEY
jgi:hypothetical protein